MKIIKKGDINKLKQTRYFICLVCGCEFEADKGEYREGMQYNEAYYYSECPTCGQIVHN